MRVDFLSGADGDLQAIFNRLEDYQNGFGIELMAVLDSYLGRIAAFPEIAPRYSSDVRRQIMRTFPFGIFYSVQADRILVVAILDLRQDPAEIRRQLHSRGG